MRLLKPVLLIMTALMPLMVIGNAYSEAYELPKKIVCKEEGVFMFLPQDKVIGIPDWQHTGKTKYIRALIDADSASWTINYPSPNKRRVVYAYESKDKLLYYNDSSEKHSLREHCESE